MAFLKRLFGGGAPKPDVRAAGMAGDPVGLYYFVQPDHCDEVIRVRINRDNDLTLLDDESGYWVRKTVRGSVCFTPVELDFTYDRTKRLTEPKVTGGKLVDQDAYTAWTESRNG